MEVVVVIDGPDEETESGLRAIGDTRLGFFTIKKNVGHAEAKNIGARLTVGKYIAFLDDDDEWFPEKIAEQVAIAESLHSDSAVVFCRFLDKSPNSTRKQPYNFPASKSNFSEYLFCQRENLQTSTWMVSRDLMLKLPFKRGLGIEDADWLLRAMALPETRIGCVDEVLSVYNTADDTTRLTGNGRPWEPLYEWATANRSMFTRKAFASFLLTYCFRRAKQQHAGLKVYMRLFWDAVRLGSVGPRALVYLAGYALVPGEKRRLIRDWISRGKG
jgi:glycosyltransferase involved in cell wall biosynthesis